VLYIGAQGGDVPHGQRRCVLIFYSAMHFCCCSCSASIATRWPYLPDCKCRLRPVPAPISPVPPAPLRQSALLCRLRPVPAPISPVPPAPLRQSAHLTCYVAAQTSHLTTPTHPEPPLTHPPHPRATTHPPTELHPHPHARRHHPHTPAAAHTQTRTQLTAMQHPHSPHSSRRKTYESCLRLPYPTHRTLAFAARADIRSDADECFLIYSSPTAFAVDDLTIFSMRLAHTLATYYTEIVGLKALSAVKSSSVLYSAHVYN